MNLENRNQNKAKFVQKIQRYNTDMREINENKARDSKESQTKILKRNEMIDNLISTDNSKTRNILAQLAYILKKN